MAVDVAPAAHRADGGALPISSALVPACAAAAAICIIAASASYASTPLSYYATFAVSLVCFARAAWPDRVDGALAYARRKASRARADLEVDLRHLGDAARGHRATAPVYAGAAGCARHARATVAGWAARARRRAEATWDEHKDAACAARFVLRLVALVARLAATVLFEAACDEAKACAPSVLGYLRGVVDGVRPPSCCNKGGDDEAGGEEAAEEEAAGFVLKDIVCLVGTGFYLLFTMQLLFSSAAASGMQFCAVCFAATCGLTMLIADWIDPPDDDADETDATTTTTHDSRTEGDAAAAAGETSRDEELEVRGSWRFLWVLVLVTHCVDTVLLHVTLGPQPATLAILALCNLEVLKVGRQVQLAPDDDGEGAGAAEGSAAQDLDGAVNKWRRAAMVVYAACSVKVFVIYLVLDCYLAALGFLWLFVMADLLLAEEDNLSDFDASGEDDQDGQSAGFEVDVTGGAEGEEVDEEGREEHYNANSSEDDEEESYAHCDSASEDEEGNSAHCHSSEKHENVEEQRHEAPDCGSGSEDEDESSAHYCHSSEEHENVEEQRHEGPDCGSGGSTDVDPEMPAKANRGANRKSRLFPWKRAV